MQGRLPAETLRDALAPVDALVNEAVLYPTGDELVFHALHSSKDASVTVTLPSTAFDTYTSKDTTLAINVQRPTGVLSYFSPTGTLTITTPPHNDRFQLEMGKSDSTYTTPPIDPSTVSQRAQPTTDHRPAAAFSISNDSALPRQSLTAADLCTQSITIQTRQSPPELTLAAAGDDDAMYAEFARDDLSAYYGATTSETYDLNKLTSMYDALRGRTEHLHAAIDTDGNLLLTATHTETDTTTRYILAAAASEEGD